jgi:uncharacterized protein
MKIMATAIKTPGVYIQELNAFPNSVVQVPTAVPAFIGYTDIRPSPTDQIVPTRVTSLAEYTAVFGKPPKPKFKFTDKNSPLQADAASQFLLYYGLRLFFDNGGGPCWIVSIGTYTDGAPRSAQKFVDGITALNKIPEPTMLVASDAVLLDRAGWQEVSQQMLAHCQSMQSRVSILDVFQGDTARTNQDATDVITLFRNAVTDNLNYGQAYYPWVNTSITDDSELDFSFLTSDSLAPLKTALDAEVTAAHPDDKDPKKAPLLALNAALAAPAGGGGGTTPPAQPASTPAGGAAAAPPPTPTQVHRSLMVSSNLYASVMDKIKDKLNLLPPAAGMAGVYTRVDNTVGVFKAPANTGMASVLSPSVNITNEEQDDLNAPLNGKAVNAIRAFPGRGVLIWGARTLDGNSQDWRYINVRRTIIMLEQSIKNAALAYVFEPNNASTWVTVKNMISNFLVNQWKAGALVGAKPEEAFSVDVGLGSTMTSDDILNGFMNVTVKVALVRPAEFIVITFQQKMQTS